MKLSERHKSIYNKYIEVIQSVKSETKKIKWLNKFIVRKEIACEQEVLAIEGNITQANLERKKSGTRVYSFYNGDTYIGKMIDGKMHGRGTYVFSEGDWQGHEYTGHFVDDIKCGKGICTFPNGSTYVGEWENDTMHGIGQITYKSEDEYIGEWNKGQKEGMGIYIWSNKSTYVGKFRNGKMDGVGTCYDEYGNVVYKGEWKNNLAHGRGTFIWSEEKKYIGEFLHGKKHGFGTLYMGDEIAYQGDWRFDRPCIFNQTIDEILSKIKKCN